MSTVLKYKAKYQFYIRLHISRNILGKVVITELA